MSRILITLAILSVINICMSTVCRDGSQCPGTNTCCLSPSGVGCCPYEMANCCEDGLHCCPNGYTCDISTGRCNKASGSNEFLSFVSTHPVREVTMFKSTPKSTINPADILKCFSDFKPFITDFATFIKLVQEKDFETISKLLVKFASEGYSMATDCYKVIEELQK